MTHTVHHGIPGGPENSYRHVPNCPVTGFVRLTDDPGRVTCPDCLESMAGNGEGSGE